MYNSFPFIWKYQLSASPHPETKEKYEFHLYEDP